MKLTVCIGSSCHLKGSRQIVEDFQKLIEENHLEDKIELVGTFCLGEGQDDQSVKIYDTIYNPSPADAKSFFKKEVLARAK